MIQRETAMLKAENRDFETPETRQPINLKIGDVVQVRADGKKAAGKIGVIIGSSLYERKRNFYISYTIKLSDTESIQADGSRLRFLRRDNDTTDAAEI